MKKIHVCLYLKDLEVININDVEIINFLPFGIYLRTYLNTFYYMYNEFDKIEVDYYD